jgi:hypothetical protein
MRYLLAFSFGILGVLLLKNPVMAQGCSDAGFCTIGTLNQQSENTTKSKKRLTLLLPIGLGDAGVFVFTPGLQYDHTLNERWSAQAKLTANYAQGSLGQATGLGDFFLSATHTVIKTKNWNTAVTLGGKFPLHLGNLKAEDKALPMQYQSSLGTIDLITGISLASKTWQFAAGWQQPLSGINRNNFLPEYWNTPEAEKFPPTNNFNRKGDVLLRAAYTHSIKKFSFTGGLLAIYHLADDTYINANISNDPIAIVGSKGLTLNATLLTTYQLSEKITLALAAGTPLVYRDVRPDGLTRSIVLAPEIRWNF